MGKYETLTTTFNRTSGNCLKEALEYAIKDVFTRSLLAMVLLTGLMIIFIPVSAHKFEVETAKTLCSILAITLLPGYAAMLWMLMIRCKAFYKPAQKSKLKTSAMSNVQRMTFGIQSLLFASLLCSTFILRQQLDVLNHFSADIPAEQVVLKKPGAELQDVPLFPLLRQYLSI